jgi:putative intracellular protease/amidase
LRAAFLVVDGVYNTELMAPYDVFQHTASHARPGMEVFTVSPTGAPVTTAEGLRITPQYGFGNAPAADILVVPSARGSMDADLKNQGLVDWVRRTGGQARYVVSLCDGAFVLAQAGLLDGVPATTFPEDYPRFARAGVVASMQLQWAMPGPFTDDALRPYIGPARHARMYPARSLAQAGARLAGGSDWPVDPLLPFSQIATAIDRSNPEQDSPPLNPNQALTRSQSLVMHTAGAAYQLHDRNSGTVRPGQRADLMVLDRDITRVPVEEIRARLLAQWFDQPDGASAQRVVDLVVQELDLALPTLAPPGWGT